MAELILTEEEKAAPTYLEWDDDALGKLVKKTAAKLHDEYGRESAFAMTGVHLLLGTAITANATESTYTIDGLTIAGEPKGDWIVTLKRVNAP